MQRSWKRASTSACLRSCSGWNSAQDVKDLPVICSTPESAAHSERFPGEKSGQILASQNTLPDFLSVSKLPGFDCFRIKIRYIPPTETSHLEASKETVRSTDDHFQFPGVTTTRENAGNFCSNHAIVI